jgi:type II secretory pathway component PulC
MMKNKLKIILICGLIMLILMGWYSYAAEKTFQYDSKGRRDPFIPLVGKGVKLLIPQGVKSIEGIILEGIIFDSQGDSLAIINGEIIKENEVISGFILKKIEKNSIILTRNGKNYTVNLIVEE